jgi:biofilm PGA synthesis protein PgaD
MIRSPLIIDRSSTQPAWTRGRDWVLTALVWLAYFYLVRAALVDLYSLISESLAWMFAGGSPPSVPAISRFFKTLWDYCIVALANGMILIVWARYNQYRFGGQHRHIAGSAVSIDDLAALYRLPAKDIARWQGSRILVMQHDADGTLVSVTARDPGPVGPRTPQSPAAALLVTSRPALDAMPAAADN